MDRKGLEVAKFLLDWHYLLTEPPLDGSITEIYFCFVCSVYSKGKDKVSWLQFMKYLRIIAKLCDENTLVCVPKNALHQHYEDPFRCFDRITYINRLSLALLLRASTNLNYNFPSPPSSSGNSKLRSISPMDTESNCSTSSSSDYENSHFKVLDEIEFEYKRKSLSDLSKVEIPATKSDRLNYVLKLIDGEKPNISDNDVYPIKIVTNKKLIPKDINDTYTLTTRPNRLEQLDYLLNTPCSSHDLQRERARLRTPLYTFYDCCDDTDHASLLATMSSFDKNTSYCKLNTEKLKRLLQENGPSSNLNKDKIYQRYSQLQKCVETKLHFIPIVQAQTDFKLGDCSYLDTCHKMSSCRYIHYGQLMPLKKKELSSDETYKIFENIKISDFTRGESVCAYLKPELPAQWINCDLMKIDFDVFGNDYGIVIADPSWTIHMNLNYSSLKDDELLGLRMDKLQKEGLFLLWVTGRTIETGREFLNSWGYKVINQITWIKTSQLIRTISTGRTGHWLNHSKEHLLVGMKGNDIKWLNKGIDSQILISSTRETSRKPDEIYGIVERMCSPGVRKLEIFGRQHNTRPGWLTVGNQLDGVHLVESPLRARYDEWVKRTTDCEYQPMRV